jgi:hypothetical protein
MLPMINHGRGMFVRCEPGLAIRILLESRYSKMAVQGSASGLLTPKKLNSA